MEKPKTWYSRHLNTTQRRNVEAVQNYNLQKPQNVNLEIPVLRFDPHSESDGDAVDGDEGTPLLLGGITGDGGSSAA